MSISYEATYDANGNNTSLDGTFIGEFSYYYKSASTSSLLSLEWGRKRKDAVFSGLDTL